MSFFFASTENDYDFVDMIFIHDLIVKQLSSSQSMLLVPAVDASLLRMNFVTDPPLQRSNTYFIRGTKIVEFDDARSRGGQRTRITEILECISRNTLSSAFRW